jgi:3-oxoacyl-[acyl-carrier protein] reductase
MNLNGQRVLITGASGGIGSEMVRQFSASGAVIGIHYHKDRATAESLLAELRGHGTTGSCLQADLMRASACRSLIDAFVKNVGGIDILINNAGAVIGAKPLASLDERSWDQTMQLNARAPFFLSQRAFVYMQKQRSGRIINISSIAARYGGSAMTLHYGAAKASLEAVTIGMARAGAPYEILVNAIQAGFIDTRFHQNVQKKNIQKRIQMIPLKRPGRPADVAAMALFLAGPSANFITGQVLRVSGGD